MTRRTFLGTFLTASVRFVALLLAAHPQEALAASPRYYRRFLYLPDGTVAGLAFGILGPDTWTLVNEDAWP
jgi:hypothetical protein